IAVVGSERGLVVVDTHASTQAAREVIEAVRRLGRGEVTAVVNTHEHFDHTFGNHAFRAAYGVVPIHAHEAAAAATVPSGERIKRVYAAHRDDEPHADEVIETPIVAADQTFSSARVLDLGDRRVELVHPGRGHTAGDLVVAVPDADVLLVGDLVEESGPPGYGEDCWPLEWPATLDVVLGATTDATVVVPGHGAVVDRGFVESQRAAVGVVAEMIRHGAAQGASPEETLAGSDWPWGRDGLVHAVQRGYAQLPPGGRRLPLG
ncbi:MAG: MBL fold metallo-hydrolase, partial [Nocardioides sp.]